MTLIYVDTSVVVPLIVPESTTPRARRWRDALTATRIGALAVSSWTLVEFASAIAMKARSGQLSRADARAARGLFNDVVLPAMMLVEVEPTDFRLAATILNERPLGLRAGDALHLAIAVRCAASQVVTLDTGMKAAAPVLGIPAAVI